MSYEYYPRERALALCPEWRDGVSARVIRALSQGGVASGDDPRICSLLVLDAAVAGDKDLILGCGGKCGQESCDVWYLCLSQRLLFPCGQLVDVLCPC